MDEQKVIDFFKRPEAELKNLSYESFVKEAKKSNYFRRGCEDPVSSYTRGRPPY